MSGVLFVQKNGQVNCQDNYVIKKNSQVNRQVNYATKKNSQVNCQVNYLVTKNISNCLSIIVIFWLILVAYGKDWPIMVKYGQL